MKMSGVEHNGFGNYFENIICKLYYFEIIKIFIYSAPKYKKNRACGGLNTPAIIFCFSGLLRGFTYKIIASGEKFCGFRVPEMLPYKISAAGEN